MKYRMIWKKLGISCVAGCMGVINLNEVKASDDDQKDSFIIVGPAATPEYRGSSDYGVVPTLVSEFAIRNVEIEIEGPEIRAAFFARDNWKFGAAADIDFGRDDEVAESAIASMEKIDVAVNLGGFASYAVEDHFLEGDNLDFRLSGYVDTTDVHKGVFATLAVNYTLPLFIPWRFEFELESTPLRGCLLV